MKRFPHSTVVFLTVLTLIVVVAIFLMIEFISAKEFSDLCHDIEKFDSCKIFCIMVDREDEIFLTDDALDAFVSHLEQQRYYKRGSYNNTLEGTIYHIYFSSPQVDSLEMMVSDLGKVYIGSNYYEFSRNVNHDIISSYIENLFESLR